MMVMMIASTPSLKASSLLFPMVNPARSLRPIISGGLAMPRGDKDKYTDKQKRQAEHIEKGL